MGARACVPCVRGGRCRTRPLLLRGCVVPPTFYGIYARVSKPHGARMMPSAALGPLAGSHRHVHELLLSAILLLLDFTRIGCSPDPRESPLVALPSLPPFPVPPKYRGCFSEHDPNVEADSEFHGRRNVRFGRRGCSGMGGCGDGPAANPECEKHPDPAGVASCDPGQMTRACTLHLPCHMRPHGACNALDCVNELTPRSMGTDCVQQCLAWDHRFVYSATAYAKECWCDTELHLGPSKLGTDEDCTIKCSGDSDETCGGKWFATVYSVEGDPMLGLAVIAAVLGGGTLYAVGGLALGMISGRAGGRVRVAAHPHYAYWIDFAGLVVDGLHFFLRRGHQHDYTSIRSVGRSDRGKKSKSQRMHGSKRLDALGEIANA